MNGSGQSQGPEGTGGAEELVVRLVIAPSLHAYFADGVRHGQDSVSPEDELVYFLTMLHNDTIYPIASARRGDREIRLTYQPRAFADPIF